MCGASTFLVRTHGAADPSFDDSEVDKVGDEVDDAIKKNVEPNWHHPLSQPLMGGMNALRCAMCMGRPDLLDHDNCLQFMTGHCQTKDDGAGYCLSFWKKMEDQCEQQKNHLFCQYWEKSPYFKVHIQKVTDQEEDHDADEDDDDKEEDEAPAPSNRTDGIDKKIRRLPDQGYSEVSDKNVKHKNKVTMTHDWRKEWPKDDATENGSYDSICQKQPDTPYCKMWLKARAEGSVLSSAIDTLSSATTR